MKKTTFKKVVCLLLALLIVLTSADLHNIRQFVTTTYAETNSAHVVYRAHCEDVGWTDYSSDGVYAGTTGRGLRLEALLIQLEGVSGSIVYHSYMEQIGWQAYASDGQVSGTTGRGLKLEAIQMDLTGEAASKYDLYYQVHKADLGWTGWGKQGSIAGSGAYLQNRIEAIQILLVPKGSPAPTNLPTNPSSAPKVNYSAHVMNIGWQDYAYTMGVAGTTGQSMRLEALRIRMPSMDNFGIEYRTYVQGTGWQNWFKNNEISGTTGQLLNTTALAVRLTGYLSANYNVYYRTYSNGIGWSIWASNGQGSGYAGSTAEMEAFQLCIRKKSEGEPPSTLPITALTNTTLSISSHVQDYGWLNPVGNNEIAGTTGHNKQLEALKMSVVGNNNLKLTYSAHVQDIGWQNFVNDGSLSGTSGQCRRIEALKIKLTGSDASKYDVYYRSHVQNLGWLGWTKNGEISGSTGLCYHMEALQVIILPAGSPAPGPIGNSHVTPQTKGIDVSKWQGDDINWSQVAASGIQFAMVRIGQGSTYLDPLAKQNINGANAVGIKTGVYLYSVAANVEDARNEAYATLQWLKGVNINYPIAYDVEANNANVYLSRTELANIILTYKSIVEANGYRCILYANADWLKNRIDTSMLGNMDIWVARYGSFDPNSSQYLPTFDGHKPNEKVDYSTTLKKLNVTMWQHTETGSVPGIKGNVDLDIGYKLY